MSAQIKIYKSKALISPWSLVQIQSLLLFIFNSIDIKTSMLHIAHLVRYQIIYPEHAEYTYGV